MTCPAPPPLQDETTEEITFYVKGADVVMATIVQYNDWLEEEVSAAPWVVSSEGNQVGVEYRGEGMGVGVSGGGLFWYVWVGCTGVRGWNVGSKSKHRQICCMCRGEEGEHHVGGTG